MIAAPSQIVHASLQFRIGLHGKEPSGGFGRQAVAERANKSIESWSSLGRVHHGIIPCHSHPV